MASGSQTRLGEAAPAENVDIEEIEPGVWKISGAAGETVVYEIAHADFTGDGLGEILTYVSVGPAGGGARSGATRFPEKTSAGGSCAFSARQARRACCR